MKTFQTDFAYLVAEKKRERDMRKLHILSEGVAYIIVLAVSALAFMLAVVSQ